MRNYIPGSPCLEKVLKEAASSGEDMEMPTDPGLHRLGARRVPQVTMSHGSRTYYGAVAGLGV